ncbi:WxcM-like domain-containing protein [Sphingobacterium thalpophilum]|uniref:WxcM-like, C-terminal n=1 Tax=Sphingobacterium thalpophilum TaxID=259 RepID=A0A4U9UXD3_9SPHI|nr:WxcM-like domain-containing protein [Sphingobacterium thalpophilum]VTR34864.1 WxcM-like, C-terminal [Sphingobacterium thalpophilum]
MEELRYIQGGVAKDMRGQIRFVNEFDMSLVKRFYLIRNVDTELIRGWRAHRIEQRWFYVLSGAFKVSLVQIDDWEDPNPFIPIKSIVLDANDMKVLHVPAGYGTAFRALTTDSELLVYADHPVEHAPLDNYTWKSDYFNNVK